MLRRSTLFTLVAAAAVIAAGLFLWMARPVQATGVKLQYAPLVRTLQFSARVSALSRVDVGSTVTGRVSRVYVAEGALVKKGALLVSLESEELTAALLQAQANERLAAAKLTGLRSTGRSTVQSAVAQADSVLVAARAEYERTKKLVEKEFLSEARLDEAKRAVAVAQAQANSALAQRTANAEQGTDIEQAQAQLALAQSASTAARARLAQAQLMAPADAKVLNRLVEPGQIVQPGRALMSLATQGTTLLIAQVDERYLEQLQVGQSASVLADAYPGQRFMAKVQSISPLVDAQRGAIEVKFSVTGTPPAFLREDMTLSVEVETARRERALVLPINAVRSSDASSVPTVLIEQDGRVTLREVKLGLRSLNAVEVVEGLREGDVVISGSAPKPGDKVRVDIAQPTGLNKSTANGKGGREDAGSAFTNAMGR